MLYIIDKSVKMSSSNSNNKIKSVEQIYQKKSPIEHIKDLPDTYIGSIEITESNCWVYDNDKIINKQIKYIPGLYKIYDEIIVNVIDHHTRLKHDDNEKQEFTGRFTLKIADRRCIGIVG